MNVFFWAIDPRVAFWTRFEANFRLGRNQGPLFLNGLASPRVPGQLQKFFKSCLVRNGYYAISTDDVDKALKLVRAWQPDLVMIDMHLADNATEWLIKSI